MSEKRSASAAALGRLCRTARQVSIFVLFFGCDGPPGLQDGAVAPPKTGRGGSELERIEFHGEIINPGPPPEPRRGRSELERESVEPSEDLQRLPAPVILKAGKDPVHSVAFSPSGDIVAAGDGMSEGFAYRGKLYLWESRSGKLIASHAGFRRPVERICFSDSGKVVAASPLFGGPVIVWEVGQESRKAKLGVSSYVVGLASETEALVAVERPVDEKSETRRWDIARWRFDQPLQPEDILIENAGVVTGLSGNKQVLFGYNPEGRVVFWSTGDWKKLGEIDVGESDPHAISDDGRLFAAPVDVWAKRGPTTLDIWDVREQKLLGRWRTPTRGGALRNMVFHTSGEVLAENYSQELLLRDLKTGRFFATWSPPRRRDGPNKFTTNFTITSLAFSRDGNALAAGLFHTREVAVFRIGPGDLKRLRETAKTSSTEEAPDTGKPEPRDGTKD